MRATEVPTQDPAQDPAGAGGAAVVGTLSPSRAGDFMTCPLLYRYRVIDRIPERPSPAAVRGTLVHAVLERLFDLPAAERTPDAAVGLLVPEWERLLAAEPELAGLFARTGEESGAGAERAEAPAGAQDGAAAGESGQEAGEDGRPADGAPDGSAAGAPGEAPARAPDGPGDTREAADGDDDARDAWLAEARAMVRRYFTLEDPRRLEPARRELYVEAVLSSGLLLRGYIDRVDVAPTGEVRVVDYKTGRSPSEMFEARALFQMKFYALVLWRLKGTVPRLLQLIYLGNGEILCYAPDEADLRATERKVEALWQAISRAMETGDWRPRRSRVCDWCDHKSRCPEFGGTPPPLPEAAPAGSAPAPAATDEAPSPRGPGDDL